MTTITAPKREALDALVAPYLKTQPRGLAFAIGYASPWLAGPGHGGIYLAGNVMDQYRRAMPLNGSTLFEIGSVSKTFTATLYALVAQRSGAKNPTVGDFFGDRVGRQFRDIPVVDLLNYTSGLPADDDAYFGPAYPPSPYTVAGMLGFLGMTAYEPRGTGEVYSYSNLGFSLAGEIAARMAGKPGRSFAALMNDLVFAPLGMTGSTYFDRVDIGRLPLGYGYSNETTCEPARPGNSQFPAHNGGGGIVTTPDDMMAWLQFNMGLLQVADLSPLLAVTQQPATAVTTSRDGGGTRLGLGWFLSPADYAIQMAWKDGGLPGCSSYIEFVQSGAPGTVASDAGVFVLANASGLNKDGIELTASLAHEVLGLMRGATSPLLDLSAGAAHS